MKAINKKNILVFETAISVFSGYITKVMVFGALMSIIIFGVIIVVTAINGGEFSDLTPDIYFALGCVGLIFFLTYIAMVIMFPKGFISKIQISEDGVLQYTSSLNNKINKVAIIGGILTKSPGLTGTGLLTEAGGRRIINWKDMSVVKINTNTRYVYFSKSRLGLFPIGFFCPEKFYKQTVELVKKNFPNFQFES